MTRSIHNRKDVAPLSERAWVVEKTMKLQAMFPSIRKHEAEKIAKQQWVIQEERKDVHNSRAV